MSFVRENSTAGLATPPALLRDRREDQSRDAIRGEITPGASPAFDALVAVLQASGSSATNLREVPSPSQMFEAPTKNADEARQQALSENDRESRLPGRGASGIDPSSIAARRAARMTDSAGDLRSERDPGSFRYDSNIKSMESRGDRVDQTADRKSGAYLEMRRLDRRGNGGLVELLGRSGSRTSRLESPPLAQAQAAVPSLNMRSSTSPVSSTVMQGGGAGSVSAANRVAEVLATGRIAETDTTRLPSAVSPAQGARQSFVRGGAPGHTETGGAHSGESRSTSRTSGTQQSNFDELVRSIRLFSGSRRSTARIRLDPPELGRIRVDLQMINSELQISVLTDSAEAKAILKERADLLRIALEHYGIHIERFAIDTVADTERLFDASWDQENDASLASFAGTRREPGQAFEAASHARAVDAAEAVDPDPAADESGAGERRLDIRI